MPDRLLVIWRDDPGQLINTIAEGKKPKLFSFNDNEVAELPVMNNAEAEQMIKNDTFDRTAVTESFARSVLGWNV